MNEELETLIKDHSDWVKLSQKIKFSEGLTRLLTELYPDNAHFIYELLQNAEDPEASEVKFQLTDSAIEFSHNGKRLFEFKDVESITSIGNSSKRDDATSIGKFGVGFKAVFAYTNTPEIHSGDFHFRIRDLVVPDTEGVNQSALNQRQTCFIFPFDNPKKPVKTAIQEISKGLQSLGDNTLLFLNHIRKIEYTLPDGSMGSLQRFDHGDGRIDINLTKPNNEKTISHWLHFQKDVDVTDEEGNTQTCRIAIAYSLVEEANKKTEEKIWKIVPLSHGQVSIYFPAEKETSNLKLHIHAPFASTVARDSVRDCPANQQLRDHLAKLIIESMAVILDQGLLTVGFLAVLPNPEDNLTVFYEPIRKAVVEVFKNESLTPTRNGSHGPSTGLFRGPARIAKVLNDEDLSFLTHCSPPFWAANPPPQRQREENFLNSLSIDSWGWYELVKLINSFSYENEAREKFEAWISEKEDLWVREFYELLNEAQELHSEFVCAEDIKIVRVTDDKGIAHVIPSKAFFPPNDGTTTSEDILFVKEEAYIDGKSFLPNTKAKLFLESIGVRQFNERTSIERILERYENPPKQIDLTYYYEDIKFCVAYWKKNPTEVSLFSNQAIFLGSSRDGKLYRSKSTELYIDAPYLETGLAELETIHGKKSLWTGYQDQFDENQLKHLVELLKATGAVSTLKVSDAALHENPHRNELWKDFHNYRVRETDTKISVDYSIEGLQQILTKNSVTCSKLVWNALIGAESKCAKARYRPNQNYSIQEADSQLVHHLKNNSWIPDKQGKCCKPQLMHRDDLPSGFPFDDNNGLLTAIGFGEYARRRSEEYQSKTKAARQNGFDSLEEMETMVAFALEAKKQGKSTADLLAEFTKKKNHELPEESVPNSERRRIGVLERSENAPSKESVMRERSIQQNLESDETKAYLKAKYTNTNREMFCQCCQNEMPFKISDSYYFEAVQCIKNTKSHYVVNRLALCPLCSAMYRHARKTTDEEIKKSLVENDHPVTPPFILIPIILAERTFQLRFVGSHWFDLMTILQNTNLKQF